MEMECAKVVHNKVMTTEPSDQFDVYVALRCE